MGERLNIEIKEGNKVLANAYYHWSGYTSSSLELTQLILNSIPSVKYEDKLINAIKLLEITGAGLTENEINYGKKAIKDYDTYNFKSTTGRNEGLIGISKKGIKETETWEEHRVEINLDTKLIDFDAIWKSTKEEYLEDYGDDEDKKYEDIPIYDIDFHKISFDEFSEFNKNTMKLINKEIYNVRLKDDESVYGFIE